MAGNVREITEAEWQDVVVNSDKPVFVDFWAPWCGPCRVVAPVIDELAAEYSEKMLFVKVNVDDNQRIAGNYQVMSIPTFAVFKNGAVEKRFVGAMPKERFVAELSGWLE